MIIPRGSEKGDWEVELGVVIEGEGAAMSESSRRSEPVAREIEAQNQQLEQASTKINEARTARLDEVGQPAQKKPMISSLISGLAMRARCTKGPVPL